MGTYLLTILCTHIIIILTNQSRTPREVFIMSKYFKNVETLEELRKQYRDLLKKFHPDNGGSEEITKEINTEYEQLFKVLKNRHERKGSDRTENGSKKSYEDMKWNFEEDEKLRDILNKAIHFENITIEIIGSFIWISGNTYPYKKELKELGFKWASQKKNWYWHSEAYVKKSHKNLSMDEIRNYYGSTEVETEGRKRLATA